MAPSKFPSGVFCPACKHGVGKHRIGKAACLNPYCNWFVCDRCRLTIVLAARSYGRFKVARTVPLPD